MPIHLSHKMRFAKKSCGKTLISHGRQDRKTLSVYSASKNADHSQKINSKRYLS